MHGYLEDKRRPRYVSWTPPPDLTHQGVLSELQGLICVPFENECTRMRGRTRGVELLVEGRQPRPSRAFTTGRSLFSYNAA